MLRSGFTLYFFNDFPKHSSKHILALKWKATAKDKQALWYVFVTISSLHMAKDNIVKKRHSSCIKWMWAASQPSFSYNHNHKANAKTFSNYLRQVEGHIVSEFAYQHILVYCIFAEINLHIFAWAVTRTADGFCSDTWFKLN